MDRRLSRFGGLWLNGLSSGVSLVAFVTEPCVLRRVVHRDYNNQSRKYDEFRRR